MKKNYIRSDFADELITQDIKSKTFEHIEKKNDFIKSNYIKVLEPKNELAKEIGDYVSIECINLNDKEAREHMVEAIQENLEKMTSNMKIKLNKILIVGLGNRMITSDALGPNVASEIMVTAHLYQHEDHEYLKGTRNVAVLQPGVMGQTGLETFTIIKSVSNTYHPDLIIAVDALATRNISRINRVVQINNTGIQPGSGVGNHRQAIHEKTLHVPIIAIGVATVTSIAAIMDEILTDSNIDLNACIQNLEDKSSLDLVVTPKSMDEELKNLIYVVSQGINAFVHPAFYEL